MWLTRSSPNPTLLVAEFRESMKKIAIGCGIVALIITVLGIAAGVFGVRWAKQQFANAERLERVMEEMEAAYGKPEDFQPPVDGNYPADRVQLFVRMRGELLTVGEEFRFEVEDMALDRKKGWWSGIRAMAGLLNAGAGYLATADSLLLEEGMSHGEYAHYQTLMLHGFLGESPVEFLDGMPSSEDESSFFNTFDDIVEQYMLDARSMLQDHARNSRKGAGAQGSACTECEEWVGYLDTQLENSRSRSDTMAMTDPLAPSLAEAFADRRYELEATRPSDYGTWLLSILMVMELDDDGDGIKVEFGD
jgi:hypothetical protein